MHQNKNEDLFKPLKRVVVFGSFFCAERKTIFKDVIYNNLLRKGAINNGNNEKKWNGSTIRQNKN